MKMIRKASFKANLLLKLLFPVALEYVLIPIRRRTNAEAQAYRFEEKRKTINLK